MQIRGIDIIPSRQSQKFLISTFQNVIQMTIYLSLKRNVLKCIKHAENFVSKYGFTPNVEKNSRDGKSPEGPAIESCSSCGNVQIFELIWCGLTYD